MSECFDGGPATPRGPAPRSPRPMDSFSGPVAAGCSGCRSGAAAAASTVAASDEATRLATSGPLDHGGGGREGRDATRATRARDDGPLAVPVRLGAGHARPARRLGGSCAAVGLTDALSDRGGDERREEGAAPARDDRRVSDRRRGPRSALPRQARPAPKDARGRASRRRGPATSRGRGTVGSLFICRSFFSFSLL